MDEMYNEPLLRAYALAKIDAKGRWEQDQLNELEGFAVLEQLTLIQNETE